MVLIGRLSQFLQEKGLDVGPIEKGTFPWIRHLLIEGFLFRLEEAPHALRISAYDHYTEISNGAVRGLDTEAMHRFVRQVRTMRAFHDMLAEEGGSLLSEGGHLTCIQGVYVWLRLSTGSGLHFLVSSTIAAEGVPPEAAGVLYGGYDLSRGVVLHEIQRCKDRQRILQELNSAGIPAQVTLARGSTRVTFTGDGILRHLGIRPPGEPAPEEINVYDEILAE